MRVLIVDDSMTMRRVVADAVRNISDVEIMEAVSAEDAREILYENADIGLVLLDYHLPGMTGIDFLQTMRQDTRISHVPVIMITAEREKSLVISALRAGAKNYIVKPFTHHVFKQKVGPHITSTSEDKTRGKGGLVGSLGQTSPLEVIQLIAMTKKTGVLEFTGQGKRFNIYFKAGQIEHASGGGLEGEAAVSGATALRDGVFNFRAKAEAHPVTIRRSTEMLMLNAFNKDQP